MCGKDEVSSSAIACPTFHSPKCLGGNAAGSPRLPGLAWPGCTQFTSSSFAGNYAMPDDVDECARKGGNETDPYPGGGVAYVRGEVLGSVSVADCGFEGNLAQTPVPGGTAYGGVLGVKMLDTDSQLMVS